MRLQNGPRHFRLSRAEVAAALTAMTLKPLAAVVPSNRAGILFSRRLVATSLRLAGPPLPNSRIEPVDPRHGVRGEWVRGPEVTREDAVVLYIHGSGYALCSARTHRGLTTRMSAGTGLPVFACDYRLAPRHRFPSAADDVRAAYDQLVEQGHHRILLAGDSAGGHLAVDLTLQLLRERRVPPAGLALFSPLYDVTLTLAAARERMRPDPMVTAAAARRLIGLYTRDADPASPRLRLSFAGVTDFPPTLIQAGGREMLATDAVELARALRRAGSDCELDVVPGQMHVFQALPKVTPHARPAMERACAFLTARVPARPAIVQEAS
ncbi:acetyl esterase/lipase [Herbihabitans rhizosphaerae]|uniref:Acetyl esterase/lipase n=1 Tax=Herbihabitans rhizosphaerae TaxID=1872711 RepID=A0A4Q7KGF9_9PSEU|nr:alpha/beta hydrolase [Herbihabitans rhizosphaerae]RZS32656.1 acetyl esterase/lipase [Herbihabitans rhizosphaerae]